MNSKKVGSNAVLPVKSGKRTGIRPLLLILPAMFILLNLNTLSSQPSGDQWWNVSWNHRAGLEINSTGYVRIDWPVEYDINFTHLISLTGNAGTFDINSTRVFEYSSSGGILHEVPHQFEPSDTYDAGSSAAGTIVFILNGTTAADAVRHYNIYFDTIQNGAKTPKDQFAGRRMNMSSYNWNGNQLEINTSSLMVKIDTNRSENTSGIYETLTWDESGASTVIFLSEVSNRTVEYSEYSNATDIFSFDMRGNMSFTNGSVRVVARQEGGEMYWGQPGNQSSSIRVVKKYAFYENVGGLSLGQWIIVTQEITNTGNENVTRNSTSGGALKFDVASGFPDGLSSILINHTEPFSWSYAVSPSGSSTGVVNFRMNQSQNFKAGNTSQSIGISLNQTILEPNQTIAETSLVYLGAGIGTSDEFFYLMDRIKSPVGITAREAERWLVFQYPRTYAQTTLNETIFNRNETMLIFTNLTYDHYNLTYYINATLDNGTSGASDDIMIQLYDDGLHNDSAAGDMLYANFYNFTNYAAAGTWNLTVKTHYSDGTFLNQTSINLNVTDQYFVNMTLWNQEGFAERIVHARADVMNYRRDSFIADPQEFNCSFTSTNVTMMLNYHNGTIYMNFTAPDYSGVHTLICDAGKYGNRGSGLVQFTTELNQTNMSVSAIPPFMSVYNVTWGSNSSFLFTVNTTNIKNATARNTNITLQLPAVMQSAGVFQQCGNIWIGGYCNRTFNITVLNATVPGNYSINVTINWMNPDGYTFGSNSTVMNASVEPTVIINASKINIAGTVAPGRTTSFDSFMLYSLGNFQAQDVQFSVYNFSQLTFQFLSAAGLNLNGTNIEAGTSREVYINVTVPAGYPAGSYNGTINVTAGNDGYLTFSAGLEVSGTNMTINSTLTNYTACNITYLQSKTFVVTINATNPGNATARSANISAGLPWNFNSTPVTHQCGDIQKDAYCNYTFNVTVLNNTAPGNYSVNFTVIWLDYGLGTNSNTTYMQVEVMPNIIMNLSGNLSVQIQHGANTLIDNFTITSAGNVLLDNVQLDVYGFNQSINITLQNSTGQNPNLTSMVPGRSVMVYINATAELGMDPGNYTGTINITTSNGMAENISLRTEVPVNRSWIVNPSSFNCIHAETPSEGQVCEVTIYNTGNALIWINVSPYTTATQMNNKTWITDRNFTVQKQQSHSLNISYNVTGSPYIFYTSIHTFTGMYSGSEPPARNLSIILTPYIKPYITLSVTPNYTYQSGSVTICVNSTNLAGYEINLTYVNVTDALNRTYTHVMDFMDSMGGGSASDKRYCTAYPSSWGNSTLDGNYTVKVYSEDESNNWNDENGSLYLFARLYIYMDTDSGFYNGGGTGQVEITARDADGSVLPGSYIVINYTNPSGNSTGVIPLGPGYLGPFTSGASGQVEPKPSFQLVSSPIRGVYTVNAIGNYTETILGITTTNTASANFYVCPIEPDLYVSGPNSVTDYIAVTASVTSDGKNVDADGVWAVLNAPNGSSYIFDETRAMTVVGEGHYEMLRTTTGKSNGMWRLDVIAEVCGRNTTKSIYQYVGALFDLSEPVAEDVSIPGISVYTTASNTGPQWVDAMIQWELRTVSGSILLGGGGGTFNVTPFGSYRYTASLTNVSYIGQVRINFTMRYPAPSYNMRAYSSLIFNTTPEPPATPQQPLQPSETAGEAGPSGPSIEAAVQKASMEIIEYSPEFSMAAGGRRETVVVVNNTGTEVLNSVRLDITGIPLSWFSISPYMIEKLNPGDTGRFTVVFSIPEGTETNIYDSRFLAIANETVAEKVFKLLTFKTKLELTLYELDRLKREIQNVRFEIEAAKKAGKDITEVELLMEQIENLTGAADKYVIERRYDDVLRNVETSWGLLKRIRELLLVAPIKQAEAVPWWMLIIIVALASVIIVLALFMNKIRKSLNDTFRYKSAEPKVTTITMQKINEMEIMNKEKEKINRVIALLEKEHAEGLISDMSFEELKKRNKDKLAEIEKRASGIKM